MCTEKHQTRQKHYGQRLAYLTLGRSHLDYATQVWTPQLIDLIRKLKRVQRRGTKYILDLPFICDQTYRQRLMNLNLLPISYWHEFLDMIFFFKVVAGTVRVSHSVLPEVLVTRTTRSNSNRNLNSLISRECNTVTFQRSFFMIKPPESGTRQQMTFNFHATFTSPNSNPSCTRTTWMPQNVTTTLRTHDPEKPSVLHVTFHVTCLSVSIVIRSFTVSYIYFKLWDHCNWLTTVVAPLPIKRLLFIVQ